MWSRRTKKVIERSPTDAIAVYLTLRGDAWFECADRTYALRPGNILVSETDQPFARGFKRGLEELVVKVDRDGTARDATAKLGRSSRHSMTTVLTACTPGHWPESPAGPRGPSVPS